VSGPAAPPVPAGLETLMRRMRLPYLRKAAPDVLATARAQRWDPAEVLRVLLTGEVTGRDAATRRTRRIAAGFPAGKTFATWRPGDSSIRAPTQDALATLEWIGRAENLAVAGPSGTGKSHFVEALAHAAIDKDLRVAWFTLESLAAAISRARADGSVARTVTRICRCDLIVVDDIGMLPAGQDAAEAFYRITDAAYERRSLAVTSNIHPSGFDTIMPRPWPPHRRPAAASRPPRQTKEFPAPRRALAEGRGHHPSLREVSWPPAGYPVTASRGAGRQKVSRPLARCNAGPGLDLSTVAEARPTVSGSQHRRRSLSARSPRGLAAREPSGSGAG
jgi:DNA replication protein DnaC